MNLYHFVNVSRISDEHARSKAEKCLIFSFIPGRLTCCLLSRHRDYIVDVWGKYCFLFFGNKLIGKDRLTKQSSACQVNGENLVCELVFLYRNLCFRSEN